MISLAAYGLEYKSFTISKRLQMMNKAIGYSYARNIMNSNDVCDTQQTFTFIYLYDY